VAQSLGEKLDTGDRFPDLELSLVSGGMQRISALAAGQWSVVLLYRGDW
jgi:peroxiredoxin